MIGASSSMMDLTSALEMKAIAMKRSAVTMLIVGTSPLMSSAM